jgi:hypothetical protein
LHALGRVRGDVGYLVSDPARTGALWFHPLGRDRIEPAIRLPAARAAPRTACPHAQMPDDVTEIELTADAWTPSVLVEADSATDLHVTIERARDGAFCIRRIVRGATSPSRSNVPRGDRGLTLHAVDATGMRGVIAPGDGASPASLDCRVGP